jgi:hypothetical protein
MKVRSFDSSDISRWEDMVFRCAGSSIFHSRRFLDYHGDRFIERSLLIENTDGKTSGLFPMASRRETPELAVSHPGATFGGLLLSGNGSLSRTEMAFDAAFEALRRDGVRQLQYTPPPVFLGSQPNQIDMHLMLRYGATVDAAHLLSVADLAKRPRPTKGRKAGIARGARLHLKIIEGDTRDDYKWFHGLLVETLFSRHKAKPIHDLRQMNDLRDRLGEHASLILVSDAAEQLVAGCWIFKLNPFVWHTQYIASNEAGRSSNAVEFMISQIINQARDAGVLYLSMGTSDAGDGHGTDRNLFAFKTHFGLGAVVLWRFLLNLDNAKPRNSK